MTSDTPMEPTEPREARTPAIVATGVAVTPEGRAPRAKPSVVVLHWPASAAAESFRSLYYSLRRAVGGAPLGMLGVCSAARGEGRSTIAANLAFMAARETGQPTALIDADLRSPRLAALLGIDGEMGLSDVLANRADLDAVIHLHAADVAFVPGGRPEPEPARRFTSPRFARFLAQMRHRYDEAVVDLSPLACADARLVASQCSGVLFVVRSGRTAAPLARESLAGLEGVKVLGAVLNDAAEAEAPALRAARLALPGH